MERHTLHASDYSQIGDPNIIIPHGGIIEYEIAGGTI
jgi:hypothetical protein